MMPKRIKRWNGFSVTNASQHEAKLTYVKLNRQTPCPPRGAVPVNTRMWLEVFHFAHPVRFRSWRRPFQLCARQNFNNCSGGQGQSVSPDSNFAQNMRTNRFAIMALAVCLLLPNLAQAFYNPQTGHWLCRDPAWTPFIRPLVMRQFPVVSVCCFAATQGSGGRRA